MSSKHYIGSPFPKSRSMQCEKNAVELSSFDDMASVVARMSRTLIREKQFVKELNELWVKEDNKRVILHKETEYLESKVKELKSKYDVLGQSKQRLRENVAYSRNKLNMLKKTSAAQVDKLIEFRNKIEVRERYNKEKSEKFLEKYTEEMAVDKPVLEAKIYSLTMERNERRRVLQSLHSSQKTQAAEDENNWSRLVVELAEEYVKTFPSIKELPQLETQESKQNTGAFSLSNSIKDTPSDEPNKDQPHIVQRMNIDSVPKSIVSEFLNSNKPKKKNLEFENPIAFKSLSLKALSLPNLQMPKLNYFDKESFATAKSNDPNNAAEKSKSTYSLFQPNNQYRNNDRFISSNDGAMTQPNSLYGSNYSIASTVRADDVYASEISIISNEPERNPYLNMEEMVIQKQSLITEINQNIDSNQIYASSQLQIAPTEKDDEKIINKTNENYYKPTIFHSSNELAPSSEQEMEVITQPFTCELNLSIDSNQTNASSQYQNTPIIENKKIVNKTTENYDKPKLFHSLAKSDLNCDQDMEEVITPPTTFKINREINSSQINIFNQLQGVATTLKHNEKILNKTKQNYDKPTVFYSSDNLVPNIEQGMEKVATQIQQPPSTQFQISPTDDNRSLINKTNQQKDIKKKYKKEETYKPTILNFMSCFTKLISGRNDDKMRAKHHSDDTASDNLIDKSKKEKKEIVKDIINKPSHEILVSDQENEAISTLCPIEFNSGRIEEICEEQTTNDSEMTDLRQETQLEKLENVKKTSPDTFTCQPKNPTLTEYIPISQGFETAVALGVKSPSTPTDTRCDTPVFFVHKPDSTESPNAWQLFGGANSPNCQGKNSPSEVTFSLFGEPAREETAGEAEAFSLFNFEASSPQNDFFSSFSLCDTNDEHGNDRPKFSLF